MGFSTKRRHRALLGRKELTRSMKVALVVRNLPANAGDLGDAGSIPGSGRSPEGESMATNSSILAWRIPQTEGPDGLQSTESESDTKWQHACTHISINKEQLESFSQNLWRNKAKSYSLQEEFRKHHHRSNLKSAVTDVCLPKAAAAEGAGLPFLPLTTPCNTRDQKGGLRGSRTWTIKEQVQTPSSPLDQELAGEKEKSSLKYLFKWW